MAKFVGRVSRTDLEGGAWILTTDQGVNYQLKGGDSGLLIDGRRAEVEGRLASQAVGIAMMGDVLEVKAYRVLK